MLLAFALGMQLLAGTTGSLGSLGSISAGGFT